MRLLVKNETQEEIGRKEKGRLLRPKTCKQRKVMAKPSGKYDGRT